MVNTFFGVFIVRKYDQPEHRYCRSQITPDTKWARLRRAVIPPGERAQFVGGLWLLSLAPIRMVLVEGVLVNVVAIHIYLLV